MEQAGAELRQGISCVPAVPFVAPHGPLHATTAGDSVGGQQMLPAETVAARPGRSWYCGGPILGRRRGEGPAPRDLGVLEAPHLQELHPEVLLAERRVVKGLAVLRVPPEQVGVEGQSLASTSTCKSMPEGWDPRSPLAA